MASQGTPCRYNDLCQRLLENRELFAVNVSLSGFQLNIEGDNQSNGISVETANAGAPLVVKEWQNGSYVQIFSTPTLGVASIVINGKGGNDTISIADNVYAPATILGGAGNDYLKSGGGNATIWGNAPGADDSVEADTLIGGDVLAGGERFEAHVLMLGQGGNDLLVSGNRGETTMYGGDGDDHLWGNNTPAPFPTSASLYGGNGNDTLHAQAGFNSFFGGAGVDVLSYEHWVSDLIINVDGQLSSGKANSGSSHHLVATDLEGDDGRDLLFGDYGNDIIRGGAGNDLIWGGDGADKLFGDAGNDTLRGEWGNDEIEGGTGADEMIGGQGSDVLKSVDYASVDTLIGGDSAGEILNEDIDVAYYDWVINGLNHSGDSLFGIDMAYITLTYL